MNIKSILTSALLLASFMTAGAQTRYLNVQTGDGQYKSFEVTPDLELSWDLKNYEENKPATTTGTAKATINSVETNVNWVQLWEGGPKFADHNIGATSETDYGGYYCWGMSTDKDPDGNFKEGSAPLSGTDDTATKLWGSNWRMPTKGELENLFANCNVKWIDGIYEKYNNTTVTGLLFTGKDAYSSNLVFLPAAGYWDYGDVLDQGRYGGYWSSSSWPYGSNYAYRLLFVSGSQSVDYGYRYFGYSVRAVLAE
ncbi:MAG: hypothetical protein Q4A08_09755 [Bacteroidales bacterium]|nr:hypothetical protein [Bacteroidales bacterium]